MTDPGPEGPTPNPADAAAGGGAIPGVGATKEVEEATEGGPRLSGGEEGSGLAKSLRSDVSMASCSALLLPPRREDLEGGVETSLGVRRADRGVLGDDILDQWIPEDRNK